MDLGSSVEIIVHYLLIGRIIFLSYQNGFLMVGVLVCMVTHWAQPMVNHDVRLSGCHDSLSYYVAWTFTLRGYWASVEINRWLWLIGETLKWSYILYGLSHYWWKLVTIGILNRDTMISHGIEIVCLLRWSKGHVIMKFVVLTS